MDSITVEIPIDEEGKQALIDRVTARTKGTKGDPLTREEVEQIANAVVAELMAIGSEEDE